MTNIKIGNSTLTASQIALGCMRISELDSKDADILVRTALDEGINFFDHADIYGAGKSETIFSNTLKSTPSLRDEMVIQSKCGIRNGFFDFSKEHILTSVDSILKRLDTDYLDVLLLHRPDALVEPEEVASAFDTLHKNGKVRHFGVSNQNPMQIELLQKYVNQKLIANQLQFGVAHSGMIDAGINVNMNVDSGIDRDGSILDYCRLNDITIQAWSPFQYGFFEGVFLNNDKFPELNRAIDKIAAEYNVTNSAIATAWIMRHPANIQTIVGTSNLQRLKDICQATSVTLTREQWYEIYRAAGNILP
ncbi:MAG TPA: aldo/keto reductase family oxidoreductase [Epulopiscium sp.]|nr:aldo/keto reductase family oxidoreductase [Candidatus Epulonipiscium sp.]